MKDPTVKIPKHLAIIMDGNGRWAEGRNRHRTFGHKEGAKRVDDIVTECRRIGIEYLTLYAFSHENWNRPSLEVSVLMRLLVQHLKTMDKKLLANEVSLSAQGNISRLPAFVRKELDRVIKITAFDKPKLRLSLCLSYGGRQEIVDAARALAKEVKAGQLAAEDITEAEFRRHLYHPHFPDPDLLVRTGGESRVSNFLLWEIAYSEFVVRPEYWPEFTPEVLQSTLLEYSKRERRFGLTGQQAKRKKSGVVVPGSTLTAEA